MSIKTNQSTQPWFVANFLKLLSSSNPKWNQISNQNSSEGSYLLTTVKYVKLITVGTYLPITSR